MTNVLIGIIILIAIIYILINNKIIVKKNKVNEAYGSIDVYLKKRFDLIPNLLAVVNKYAAHEKDLLIKITELRSKTENTIKPKETISSANEMSSLMKSLQATIENYPDIKTDRQFLILQYNLTDIEEQLSAARRAYNAAVTHHNDTIQMFPANFVAGIRRDRPYKILETPQEEKKNIDAKNILS